MTNAIADRLREYADQIDRGVVTPTKMMVLFDQPNIMGVAGFDTINPAATDAISAAWNELHDGRKNGGA